MQALIYDIEIANAIPVGDRVEGINYCRGWTDYEGMGIAVIGCQLGEDNFDCFYSTASFFDYLTFLDDTDYVLVGFNSKSFDDNLLQAHGLEGIETHYDLLEEVRFAAGHNPCRAPRGYSYKLDAIARANGMAKNFDGALAPVLWQQGHVQQVVEYCLNDVAITKAILDLGLAGELIDPNTAKKLKLRELGHE